MIFLAVRSSLIITSFDISYSQFSGLASKNTENGADRKLDIYSYFNTGETIPVKRTIYNSRL